MVLNQCIVKGCHSANSENKQDFSSGGKLHPVPRHVLDDPEQQQKWIELVKVNSHSGAFRVRIRSLCFMKETPFIQMFCFL